MRCIVYKDKKIKSTEYAELLADYTKYIQETTGITPHFITLDYDFTYYSTVLDTDGDDVLRPAFLQSIADQVTRRFGEYGTDNIITLIHEDNWKSGKTATRKGIWGTNYSYTYGPYHIQYCRFDADNIVNSFGTLNHEIDHSFDALIKVETGIDVNPILGVKNYDKNSTHGEYPAIHKYIRYQENKDKLKVLAPYLAKAYKARLDKHESSIIGKKQTLLGLLNQMVYLLQMKLNSKNGIKK